MMMQLAVVSDIHGNLVALEAVVAALAAEGVTEVVCLGDVAVFGPQPMQTLARLRQLDWPVVMGNTDAWLLEPKPHPKRDENSQRITEIDMWAAEQLTAEDKATIVTFQPVIERPLGEGMTLLAYHGSPRSYNDVIRATTPDEELAGFFEGYQVTVMAGGHTHTPLVRRWASSFVLNPGSVGLPWQEVASGESINPAWAEYALLGWENGSLAISLRRVPYDFNALIQVVRDSGMPHLEWWLRDWRPGSLP
jgi:predicted phosphodiesterase